MNIDSMIQGNPQALVTSYNGVLVADSLEVADRFGKRHTHVLRSIDDLINQLESQSTQNWADYFIPDDYQDNKNRTQRRFKLTRDGFSLLVMGFTGPAALHWKLLYIEAFNKMEQALRSNLKLEINDDTGEAAPSHGPVAASSLIQQRRLIIAALEYAVDKGRINRNPGKKTRRPKSKPKTNNILTDEDMETLGIKGTKYRYYPAYMLTLTTACRRGEILGLDWQHVDIGIPWTTVDRYFPWGDIKKLPKWDTKALKTLLEDHNITLGDGYLRLVYQMVDDNGTPFRDELKTDLSRRSLMITEEMVLLLIFWRLIQNIEKKKAAERGIEYNPDNLVFCTRKGTYIYPRNFTKMWSENLRSMGIDHKRFHDLRHTVATVMLEDGEAMNTVQEQLGHYDAGFTASRYGHVTAKMRNSAAVKLGERLEKVRNPEAEDAEDANSVKNEDTIIPFQEGRKLKSAACKIK